MIRTNDGTSYKRVGGLSGDRSPLVGFQRQRALYTAAGGETSISTAALSPSISFFPGQNQITVKRSSGGVGISSIDFFETSPTTIGFPTSDPLVAGEIVEIIREMSVSGVAIAQPRPDIFTASATAGQTLVTAGFSWPYNMNPAYGQGAVRVYLHGVLQTRGIDYSEVNLSTANTNQVLFLDSLIGGENITIIPAYQVLDQSAAASTFLGQQNVQFQAALSAGFQGFVDQSATISVPSTAIVGRAKIPDLANDLRCSMGLERIQVQQIVELQNEFGPNGERVYGALNDDRGLIRYVGSWINNNDTAGARATTTDTASYVEITFYGTGLSLLVAANSTRDHRATVDGGTEGANFMTASGGSAVITGRGYSSFQIFPVASGLTLGIHTVKVRNASSTGADWFGFEVQNNSTSLNVNPGSAYISGQKYTSLTAQSLAYNSGVTGTRGGRQLVYLKSDGTIGSAFQAVDTTTLYTTSASHTNEDMVRQYSFREFGANRSDDLSSLQSSVSSRAFTLEDGTTTLVATNNRTQPSTPESLYVGSGPVTFTFVGTGLDIVRVDTATGNDTQTVLVDGVTSVTLSSTGSTTVRTEKVVSGLPYGTHTAKFTPTTTVNYGMAIIAFKVYQPKAPTLPQGAVALADFNVMATYVANTTQGTSNIGSGVLRKDCTREFTYTNSGASWTISTDYTRGMGFYTESNVGASGSTAKYTFYGTGFDLRYAVTPGTVTAVVSLNGTTATSTNFPTAAFNAYGGAFNSTTGTLNANAGAYAPAAGLSISNLPLALYTVTLTITGDFAMNWLDIITPIHSTKSNLNSDLQNSLPVGSCSLSDNRQTTAIKATDRPRKNWAQAVGIASSPTTSSTIYVPVPDLSVVIKTDSGQLRISYGMSWTNTSAGTTILCQVYMDGQPVGAEKSQAIPTAGYEFNVSDTFRVAASPGVHKIDLYFRTGGGVVLAVGVRRDLLVEEV